MRHSLKTLLLTALTAAFFAPAAFAYDKVDRSKLTREETLKQLGKDLDELRRVVMEATKETTVSSAKEKIVCPDLNSADPTAAQERLSAETEKLQKAGYSFWGFAVKDIKQSYVGTGMRLGYIDEMGIMKAVVGTIPGSPAARTEFFDQPYIIFEIDGKDVFWNDMKDIQRAIKGDGKAAGGVTLTVQRVDGGRDFVRFLERKHITITTTVMCGRYLK